MAYSPNAVAIHLLSASRGFDHLFADDIPSAEKVFASENDPFHLVGSGYLCFLEASLGLDSSKMGEAARLLSLAEAGSRTALKAAAKSKLRFASTTFPPGLEYEIANADTVVLLGVTHALSESYMGYLQCLYSMNSAYGKFSKLYKTVFPNGLDSYSTPLTPLSPFSTPSSAGSPAITSSAFITTKPNKATRPPVRQSSSFFSLAGRWGSDSASSSASSLSLSVEAENPEEIQNLKSLIIAGTAFGFGLFNLIFSLLPKKIQSVAGLFGFAHDRRLALQALAVSAEYAAEGEVHGVLAGLVLMTYHGTVLLLSGYQADEARIIREYEGVVRSIEARYPTGALWILNRAKIYRMTCDPESAIHVITSGLEERENDAEGENNKGCKQGDSLLLFELAWIHLSQRHYMESAAAFLKLTELTGWSHGTYYFIAAGCHISLALSDNAQGLLDAIPSLLDKRTIGGKELPTEVLIKKKLAFYKKKQKRLGGDEAKFVECIRISPAEEMGIFWNTHNLISPSLAKAHIKEWSALSPPLGIDSPYMADPISSTTPELDTPDELALRFLLLGIAHRSIGCVGIRIKGNSPPSTGPASSSSTWIGGLAMFELAVLDLKEVEVEENNGKGPLADLGQRWKTALESARIKLDAAMNLSPHSIDLSSQLDIRVSMLRDEIDMKAEMIGLTA
ncbi:outer membrane protein Iml2/Tetratricopeptide repeat protein 39 [Lentinula novae-zelandiae]|nr:outer membrane protein Iml2/Tetratricopeptide repeat protein 39 [Lentinula novae-zelandiae]